MRCKRSVSRLREQLARAARDDRRVPGPPRGGRGRAAAAREEHGGGHERGAEGAAPATRGSREQLLKAVFCTA